VRRISSRQNPIVRAYRELAADPPADGSRLLLDGVHLVQEACAAGLAFEQVAVSTQHADDGSEAGRLADVLLRQGVDVVAVSEPVMAALSPVRSPSGIVAIARRAHTELPAMLAHPRALVVAAVDVQDPGNLGALLRAAEAGGATGAVICGASASPFSWKAVRGSMGTALRLPIAAAARPDALLASARSTGLRTVASVPRDGEPPAAIDWRSPVLLFVGGEGPGLDPETIAACDARVSVPMEPPVESLNVAVAGALIVYEARRQRAARAGRTE
jgi:TrmH family RNA methyltransferase